MGRQARAERPSREELKAMYVDEKLTTTQIAEKLGCPAYTIKSWCARYGIRKDGQEPKRGVKRDPKRVSWLDEEGEAVSKPEHAPNTKPKQVAQLVLNPQKGRRKQTLPKVTRLCELGTSEQVVVRRMVSDFRIWLEFRRGKANG